MNARGDNICCQVSKTYLIKVVIQGCFIGITGQYIVYDRSACLSKYALLQYAYADI